MNGAVRLVLGSASPRRSALLRQIGASFDIRAAHADETLTGIVRPREYVSELSLRKAGAAAELIMKDGSYDGQYGRVIIIGADTAVVTEDGDILGKPADDGDAKRMLARLSGKWHEVYTGVALVDMRGGRQANGFRRYGACAEYEMTRVKMCEIGAGAIDLYVNSGEPGGKAGAYAIQGAGSLFIERVEGCYYNVVGLPLRLLYTMLTAMGYDLLKTNCLG